MIRPVWPRTCHEHGSTYPEAGHPADADLLSREGKKW